MKSKTTPFEVDLTKRPPRSPRVKLGEFVILPRVIDKAKAALAGTLGEYHFGRGMDMYFFTFVGIEPKTFQKQIEKGLGDWAILEWVEKNAFIKRADWEVMAWSDYHLRRGLESDEEMLSLFGKMINQLNPHRADIKTRFDLLDLDDHCSFGGKA